MFRRFKILRVFFAVLLMGTTFGCGCNVCGLGDCLPKIPDINLCDLSLWSAPCESLNPAAAIVTAILNEELAG